jgi:hypothetical protein
MTRTVSASPFMPPRLLSTPPQALTALAPDLAHIVEAGLDQEEGEVEGGGPPKSLEETLAELRSKLLTVKRSTPRPSPSFSPGDDLTALLGEKSVRPASFFSLLVLTSERLRTALSLTATVKS